MPTKRIVCLANSRKLSGRCVAGRLYEGKRVGDWLRPVSARVTEEVDFSERRYENGDDPALLDIVDVPLLRPKPKGHQQENWLLDPTAYWKRVGRLEAKYLAALVENPARLWANESSTALGLNDQISEQTARKFKDSLQLIVVRSLRLHVVRYGPRLRVQGRFRHCDTDYWLWVTDPVVEETYKARGVGEYSLGELYITVSLGESYEGYCYKLIAAIIRKK
ncbi:MAG: hypothetical protein A3G81_12465 [Betaproteobacteria bacterium RIFCSPLOWO2_12_FULL_65_14]|nr:MAG: hypothetical protein A3G81_12465 [Betaproteobacteria bacterium RIFCSPLOWO2_12_FULL_65_14]